MVKKFAAIAHRRRRPFASRLRLPRPIRAQASPAVRVLSAEGRTKADAASEQHEQ